MWRHLGGEKRPPAECQHLEAVTQLDGVQPQCLLPDLRDHHQVEEAWTDPRSGNTEILEPAPAASTNMRPR